MLTLTVEGGKMIIGERIPSDLFFWHPDDAMFTQDISSLSGCNLFGQLYDDACDEGFVMVSKRTGEELPFYLDETKEGCDSKAWTFKPVTSDPRLSKLTVEIFND